MSNARPVSARQLRRCIILALGITDNARDLMTDSPSLFVGGAILSQFGDCKEKRDVAVQGNRKCSYYREKYPLYIYI